MTEVQRLRDMALSEILKYVSIGQRREYPDTAQGTMRLAYDLDSASAKQHDEDRNGIRRQMGKKDCPEVLPPEYCEGCSTGFSPAKSECRECVKKQRERD